MPVWPQGGGRREARHVGASSGSSTVEGGVVHTRGLKVERAVRT